MAGLGPKPRMHAGGNPNQLGPKPRMGVQPPGGDVPFFDQGYQPAPFQPTPDQAYASSVQAHPSAALSGQMGHPTAAFSSQAGPGVPPPSIPRESSMGGFGGAMAGSSSAPGGYEDDPDNDPPLLEELGINVDHIILRIKGVALFRPVDNEVLSDLDLSGPLAIVMALGTCLLLAGKMTFSYLYGFVFSGCVGIWALANVMSQKGGIDLYSTASIVGYGLLPVVVLAFIGIFLSLQSKMGSIIAAVFITWATAASSRFFANVINMQSQRFLIAYPIGLLYTVFTLLTIF
mmetsp:Transcript_11782/g.26682  ORF Transcript_11782/g.26682 Transcript_11782/m.26682 type:complete len:289 (+) Transcript_11782:75-941(+)